MSHTRQSRVINNAFAPLPQVQLLSNGRYHVMLTSAGGGYSHWKNLAVTRWREDGVCDNWGSFCYLRDAASAQVWSTALQPTLRRPDSYEAVFSAGHALFRRRDGDYETQTDVVVAGDDDVEVRRTRLVNCSGVPRIIDLTSYAEIVLAPPAMDLAHLAFSKLFVETEIVGQYQAILCRRRARAPDEATPWMFHLLRAHQALTGAVSYETDRMQFIGRARTTADPQAVEGEAPLSGRAGPVLDPVAAIRCRIALSAGATASVDLVSGVCETRSACMAMLEKYRARDGAERALAGAAAYHQTLLRHLHASAAEARLYARLAASVIYANAALRADASILGKNRQGQSGLWRFAISGDVPIVLLQVADAAKSVLARQIIQAHSYWGQLGLAADLVIVSARQVGASALQEAQGRAGAADSVQAGKVFVLSASQISEEDDYLLQSVARIVLHDGHGNLAQQIKRCGPVAGAPPPAPRPPVLAGAAELAPRPLQFSNGLGGFAADGREYVVTLAPGQTTPLPWVNILANPTFGTLISENGSATTWSENAHEFRLTPWSNDPVGDAGGEAYYVRDEESGRFWSATGLPAGGATAYVARHGFGYSVFEHSEDGIDSELSVFVAIDAPLKFALLTLRNRSGRPRRLSSTGYLEWVLGDERAHTHMHVNTWRDGDSGALFAHNPYNTDFGGRTAFFDADGARCVCADRRQFLGRNGTLRQPAAMAQPELSGLVGAALDPCAAIRVVIDLADGQAHEVVFRLGAAASADAARDLLRRTGTSAGAHDALAKVKQYWQHTLGAVQVKTPDRAFDILTNGWLVYQVLACRVWARNAFYQSSGAFGFRDQLQDVMALVHAVPGVVRAHLLLCASRQFAEGDVQHWWHPPMGRGVRTHCSDDYLWLAFASCRYVVATGDAGVLGEPVHFLTGHAPKEGAESCYELPGEAGEVATLYEHCVRAIKRGLRFGGHGLPLMGSGDWNDGMNLVGAGGKGESVWLGFFLYAVLTQFSELAQRHGDAAFAADCVSQAARLRDAIEHSSWDGEWYRRAWFDDGTPLGSAQNTECRIDSIAQSWSVLSAGGNAHRVRCAMDALERHLVVADSALILLLAPPFDRATPNPGYIKGYLRGVRENGGQYTHAAVWAGMAFAALGDGERAWKLCSMINPINHGNSAASIALYQTEPYVLASDVYALAPHSGRGGWTWYTGSAGWMYRFVLESLLGLRLTGEQLHFSPCVPAAWSAFEIAYRYRETPYHIRVRQMGGALTLSLDGAAQPEAAIFLINDQQQHLVELHIPAPPR